MRLLVWLACTALLTGCMETVDWTAAYDPNGDDPAADGDDPVDDGSPDDISGDDDPVTDDDPPGRPTDTEDSEPTGGPVPPGGACACDADCRGDGAHPGLCIRGICGTRATSDLCSAGSPDECPSGQRCWSGGGIGVCYPDFVAGECAGVQDADSSCVAGDGDECYSSCGLLCGLPGDPDDPVDPPDDDPPDDDPPDDDPPDDPPTGDLTPAELDLLRALNDERATYGLPPVEADERLMCAARRHALDVGSTGACGHVGSDGSWPWDRAEACGFPQDTWTVNEIAAGPGFTDGADAVWGWRHSPGHHAAIVHTSARLVGVAVHRTCFIALFDCCVASG